ncbi:MAG TPA: hypothetical protein VIF62_35645 [Labilithrix sp.]
MSFGPAGRHCGMTNSIQLQADVNPRTWLLTIHGKTVQSGVDATRQMHNEVAGGERNIAAARSLGDLSHVVYVPVGTTTTTSDLLFLDQWNSLAGLAAFFGNEHVQKGGAKVFASREPAVWDLADGFPRFHMPPPVGRNDRFIGMVRGPVKSRDVARAAFETVAQKTLNDARARGLLSREYYFRVPDPGQPASLEILGFDTWHCAKGMQEHYGTGVDLQYLKDVFTAKPETGIWERPAGTWSEW